LAENLQKRSAFVAEMAYEALARHFPQVAAEPGNRVRLAHLWQMLGKESEGAGVLEALDRGQLTQEQEQETAFLLLRLRVEAHSDPADVAASYDEVTTLFPAESQRVRSALYMLGVAYYMAKDYARAKSTFERFRTKYGETEAVRHFISECAQRS
jgi:hypothetical protein